MKTPHRSVRVAALFFALLFVATACTNSSSSSDSIAFSSELFDVTGEAVTLADFSGEPVVLNFFAAWCAPCRAELPEFEQVSNELDGSVQFVGVSTDFEQDAWLALVQDTGVTFPTFFQPSQELFKSSESLGMPTTIFIGADGVAKHTVSGRLSKETLKDLITEHLGV